MQDSKSNYQFPNNLHCHINLSSPYHTIGQYDRLFDKQESMALQNMGMNGTGDRYTVRREARQLGKKTGILGGALLLTVTNLFLRLVSILFNVFLTDRIGAAGLGLLQLISTVSIFALLVGSSGVRVAAMFLSAEEFGHRRLGGVRTAMSACLTYGAIVSTVVGTITYFLAEFIAVSWLGDARATLSIQAMAVFLPFTCLCGIMTGYFTACSRIRQLVVIEIGERLLSLALTMGLLLTWAKGDLERSCCAILLGSSLGCVADFILLYAMYHKDTKNIKPDRSLSMGSRLFRLCVPLALNDYLRSGLNTAEQLLIPYGLARYGGSTEGAMEAYGTIHAMVFPILMFPAAVLYALSDLLVPELSRARAMGRRLRIADLTGKCLRLCILFSSAVAGFLFVSAEPMGLWLYDSPDAGYYLRIFAPMVLMLYLDAITDGMLKGLAEQVRCVRYNTITSAMDVALLFLLLPRFGIGAYVFSFFITHVINLWLSLRRLLVVSRHRFRPVELFRPLLSLVVSTLLSLFLPYKAFRGFYFLLLLGASYILWEATLPKDRCWLKRVLRESLRQRD